MPTRTSTLVLCLALLGVASLAAGGAGSVDADRGGAPAIGTGPGAVAGTQHGNATVALERSTVTVRGGETTTLELTLDGTDQATVVVGGDDAGDNVTATATDGNGDGEVPLAFETGPIGTMATRFVPVDDGDDYEMLNFSEFGGPLPAGEYPITVYAGHGVSGEPADVGTLVVNERTPEPTTEPPEQPTTETATPPPEASIDYEGDGVTLQPDAGQTIEGTTSLRPDRRLTVRISSSGGTPFLKSEQVLVGENGGFSATFNLSDVEAPANATAVVLVDGERVAGPVDVVVAAQTETTAQETSSPGQDGFGAGMAVAAILAALALLRRNR